MNEKIVINTNEAPQAIGTYSQAIRVNNLVFASGQIAINPETGELVSSDFKEQAEQVIKNLKAICKACEADLSKVIKLTVFLTDLNNFASFNQIMADNFPKPYPARSAVGISSLPKGALIEAEMILAL